MTTDTTQTDIFDHALYDELLADIPEKARSGGPLSTIAVAAHERCARMAARIVAERAAPAPTDEAIDAVEDALIDAFKGVYFLNGFPKMRDKATAALTAAMPFLRAALQPAPAIDLPEWANYVEIHMGSIPEYTESIGKWHCAIRGTKDHTGSFRQRDSGGYHETWQEALAAAIAKVEAETQP